MGVQVANRLRVVVGPAPGCESARVAYRTEDILRTSVGLADMGVRLQLSSRCVDALMGFSW